MWDRIFIILLVNLVFFSKTLCYRYASDDLPVFLNPPKTRNKFEKFIFWIEGRYRSGPQVDHALTTLIHAITCVFIYTGFGASDISFLAAMLFAFNPSNNQGSVWISGRAYAFSALGMTGAMTFPHLAAIFLIGATYYNAGFLAPVIFGASNHWLFLVMMPLIWAFHWKRFRRNVAHKISKEMYEEDKDLTWKKAIIGIKTFGFYTSLAIIPHKNSFYHSFLQSLAGSGKEAGYSLKDRFFWLGVGFIGAFGYYWIFHPWNLVSFGLLWWAWCLLPFCNVMRMSQEIAERYIYLPCVGLMFALASLIIHSPVVIGVFLAMYATRLWFYMDAYQDDYYLVENSCLLSPKSWFAWHVRGMNRWENKSYQEAVIIWTMARINSPKEFKVNFNLATALRMSGHREEAAAFMKIACQNIPHGQEEETLRTVELWEKGQMQILL